MIHLRRLRTLAHLCDLRSAWGATAWYTAATVVMTWPLVLGLTRDIPGDLGDPLLNCWILGWGAHHLGRFLTGHLDALNGFWNANIFYPAPLTLAYSEHLFAQVVQILPFYALTDNLVLCYNLLFLSTFVLSALGTYLLVRDLTDSPRAAFVAGLLYGFAPYRVAQFSHLQVLSSQWMPFVLFGLHRYFQTRRRVALVGAMAALLAQNLSCGYYALFFAPFVAAYVLYEIVRRGRVRDLRLWGTLALAAGLVLAAHSPFIQAYRAVRAGGFTSRPLTEVSRYAADVLAYATTSESLRLWGGRINAMPRGEGELFPGFILLLLASVGFVWLGLHASKQARARRWEMAPWRRVVAGAAAIVLLSQVLAAGLILARHNISFHVAFLDVRARNLGWTIDLALAALVVLLAVSARARSAAREGVRSPAAFFLAAAGAAFALSLGPVIRTGGLTLGAGPYLALYRWVPGIDGLRVPARFGMLLVLFLAVLAGFGAAALERRVRRGGVAVLAAGVLFLVEATAAPIALNTQWTPPGLAPPPAFMRVGSNAPPVYRYLATLPSDTVVVEFPFGESGYELQYMFYSTNHWKPLLNGYSGASPVSYSHLVSVLAWPQEAPEDAWQALSVSGATHAVVHEAAYSSDGGRQIDEWLRRHRAVEAGLFGTDRVFVLPARQPR